MALLPLDPACTPRPSVFDPSVRDTVYNIDDLRTLDAGAFFAENWVTEGMKVLLAEAFKRLEGKTAGASGVFQLSQSMGGGKTHNLIALGLLALHPRFRAQVMTGFYEPGPLGSVPVVTFSGRKTNTPFGIWGEIAQQLNRPEVFRDFYSPLSPPGEEDWTNLLKGGPCLILLDELPPYFEAAKARPVGNTYLDAITTTALSNLLVAVNNGRLPNVCVVLTDLGGAAYAGGSASVNAALDDLAKETNRGAVTIDPVRLASNELYHILRTRLFAATPAQEAVAEVAVAYAEALRKARQMDITTASPEQLQAEIAESYPFHPAIRELYARFKENKNFQQTRALIRIMRIVVGQLWSSGAAKDRYLIGAQDYDLHSQDMLSEIRQINHGLGPAIDHDIARDTRSSVAELADGDGPPTAQDAAKLIFLSSLSQAVNPVLGLDLSEIARDLAAPGRDLSDLKIRVDELRRGWYLHAMRDGKLLYRDIQNLRAKLDTYVAGKLREQRRTELRKRLEGLFAPEQKDVYGAQVMALPAIDEIEISPDEVRLVIFEPSADSRQTIEEFYEHLQYKNRVLFLSGPSQPYESILQRAAELSAITTIIDELKASRVVTADAQLVEAEGIRDTVQGQFYQAVVSTFQTVLYPTRGGLNEIQLGGAYVANSFKGEAQIRSALSGAYKFTDKTGADDPFRSSLENKLWPENVKQFLWSELRRRAASDPSWQWHHPRAIDHLRDELIKRDQWRDVGAGYLERGPFPKPPSAVDIMRISRDEDTGRATLRFRLQRADTLFWSDSGPATTGSERVEDMNSFSTTAAKLWFLAWDSKGEFEVGDQEIWTNEVKVRYHLFQDGADRRCELLAVPGGTIRYTTSGSTPDASSPVYTEPFVVPTGSRFVLAQADADGVLSPVLRVDLPPPGKGKEQTPVVVDRGKPAIWNRRQSRDDTADVYAWLTTAKKNQARIGGLGLSISAGGDNWLEMRAGKLIVLDAERAQAEADRLKELLPAGKLSMDVETVHFADGAQLQSMVADLKDELKDGEVRQ